MEGSGVRGVRLTRRGPGRARIVLCVTILAAASASLAGRRIEFRESSAFENLMIDIFAPLQQSVVLVRRRAGNLFAHYVDNIEASKKNGELARRIRELERRVFEQSETERENERLKEFLAFGERSSYREVLAQIVAWDSSSDFRIIRINKGAASGVALQSIAITAEGLVGYVFRLTNNFADVLTILDQSNRVDAIVQRIRAHGIVEGHLRGKCSMKYLIRTEPVILNDLVLTSGLGNVYPKGVLVGSVSRIERDSYGTTQRVEITPSVDFSRLEEVVILVNEDDAVHQAENRALDSLDHGGQGE